jgi:hypothetical protein
VTNSYKSSDAEHARVHEEYWQFLETHRASSAADAMRTASASRDRRQIRDERIRDEIDSQWSAGWDYFDAVIFGMEQNGLAMLKRSGDTQDGHSPVRDALTLLHSSATMTLHEIRHLLRGGLWVGAAARWRALHELSVTAMLVAKNGVDLAQRYLDHGFVVQTRRLAEYQRTHGRGPLTPDILEERLAEVESVVKAHTLDDQSSQFGSPYGWAISLMSYRKSGLRHTPTFDVLERLAGMEKLRLLVVSAHGHVHNDSAGVRTAVLMENDSWSSSPIERFTEIVARPTFLSVIHLVPPIHLAFEPDLSKFSKLLGLLGAAVCENAQLGADAFDVDHVPRSAPPETSA